MGYSWRLGGSNDLNILNRQWATIGSLRLILVSLTASLSHESAGTQRRARGGRGGVWGAGGSIDLADGEAADE
jgi:hypothetical protein